MFKFVNRSISLYAKEKIILKPKQQKLIKVEAPFIEEFLGIVHNQIVRSHSSSNSNSRSKIAKEYCTTRLIKWLSKYCYFAT